MYQFGYENTGCTENYFPSSPLSWLYFQFEGEMVAYKPSLLTTNGIHTLKEQLAMKHLTRAAEYTCNHAIAFMIFLQA